MKKRILISVLAALVLAGGLLFVNAWQEVRFELPTGFAGLSGFADRSLLAYLEFPASATGLEAFQATARGKRFFADELMRELLLDPAEELLHAFARRLSRISGIPLGAAELGGLLRSPLALAVFPGKESGQDRLLGMLSVGSGDRLLVSLFAKLAAAVSSDGELVRTVFKGLPLYTLSPQGARALSFTLANNVLLVSPDADLIRQALANASLADTPRPADWDAFIRGAGESAFCRAWVSGKWMGGKMPLVAALYPPLGRARSIQLAAVVVPELRIDGRLFFSETPPPAALSPTVLRDLPGDALLAVVSPEFRLAGFTGIPGLEGLAGLPEPHGKLLSAFAEAVPGEWSLAFSGVERAGSRNLPRIVMQWTVPASEQDGVRRRLRELVASFPGMRTVLVADRDLKYEKFSGAKPSAYDPCYAFLGERLVFTLDEATMRRRIALSRGLARSFADAPGYRPFEKSLAGEPAGLAWLDLGGVIDNLYPVMGEHAFHAKQYSRREVALAFDPLRKRGPVARRWFLGAGKSADGGFRFVLRLAD